MNAQFPVDVLRMPSHGVLRYEELASDGWHCIAMQQQLGHLPLSLPELLDQLELGEATLRRQRSYGGHR